MKRMILMAAAAWLTATAAAMGQAGFDRFERQLEQIQRETRQRIDADVPIDQRVLVDYGGYFTFNFLVSDDTDQKTHILKQYDVIGYSRINLDGVHEFFTRVRTTYRDFNKGDDFDGLGDDWVEPTMDRGHYRFDLKRAMSAYQGETVPYNLVFQGGRQLIHWANGLVFSQEIDGAEVTAEYDAFSLTGLVGKSRPSATDIDSSRPSYNKDMNRFFYGGMVAFQATAKHNLFAYGLVQDDNNINEEVLIDLGSDVASTRFRYNSYYVGVGARGNLTDNMLYGVEAVYQGGNTLSTSILIDDNNFATVVDQRRDDISAAAIDVQVDYLFNDANRSRLTAEFLYATGDDDRIHTTNTIGGNAPGTDDNAFNAFGLINTGLAFAPNTSNLIMIRGGASTFPFPTSDFLRRLQLGINLYGFFKADPDAPIDEDTSDNSYLGFEADVYLNWQITSDLALAVRYGIFFPGEAIGGSLVPNDRNDRNFFYLGVTLAF